jgi:hypothetical protein
MRSGFKVPRKRTGDVSTAARRKPPGSLRAQERRGRGGAAEPEHGDGAPDRGVPGYEDLLGPAAGHSPNPPAGSRAVAVAAATVYLVATMLVLWTMLSSALR